MLDVVVHVPVEKLHERVYSESAGAEAEVGNVVGKADVLCIVAEEEQPAAVERGQRHQHRKQPEARDYGEMQCQRDDGQEKMTDQENARPVE